MHENSLVCILFDKINYMYLSIYKEGRLEASSKRGIKFIKYHFNSVLKKEGSSRLKYSFFFTFKFKEHFDCKCKAAPFVARCLKCTIIGSVYNYIRDKVYASNWCFCRPMKTGNK